MKVLLYLEGKTVLEKSGIGRALQHQMEALDMAGIPYTTDLLGDYDVVHINTYGPRSWLLLHAAKRRGKKLSCMDIQPRKTSKFLYRLQFLAPFVGKYLASMYQKADFVITPSEYSKKLIQGYGVTTPIIAVSNGIDLEKYKKMKKEAVFREHFKISEGQPVVVCAGLYFRRKGIEDFVKVAEKCLMFALFGLVQSINGSFLLISERLLTVIIQLMLSFRVISKGLFFREQ